MFRFISQSLFVKQYIWPHLSQVCITPLRKLTRNARQGLVLVVYWLAPLLVWLVCVFSLSNVIFIFVT